MLSMYTDAVINELRSNISLNKDKYINNEKFAPDFIEDYEQQLFILNFDVDYPVLDITTSKTNETKKQWEIDFENAVNLHKNFILKYNIPIEIFSDERFIVYLTHDVYHKYMINRWPVTEKSLNRIKEKYFLQSGLQAFTRNMFLRFFWYTVCTYDDNLENPYELTRIAFEYADPVNQIMERKYSRNPKIVKCALRAIANVDKSKGLIAKRTLFGKAINNIIGIYCLDVLKDDELIKVFEEEIIKILRIDIEDNELIIEE